MGLNCTANGSLLANFDGSSDQVSSNLELIRIYAEQSNGIGRITLSEATWTGCNITRFVTTYMYLRVSAKEIWELIFFFLGIKLDCCSFETSSLLYELFVVTFLGDFIKPEKRNLPKRLS
jgi:hypothetical protein